MMLNDGVKNELSGRWKSLRIRQASVVHPVSHPHWCFAPMLCPADARRNTAPRSLLYCGDVSRAVRKSKLYTAKVTSNSPVECDYVIGTSVLCWCLLGMCKSGRLGLPLRMGNVQFLTLYWLSGEQVDDVCVGKWQALWFTNFTSTTLTNGSLLSVECFRRQITLPRHSLFCLNTDSHYWTQTNLKVGRKGRREDDRVDVGAPCLKCAFLSVCPFMPSRISDSGDLSKSPLELLSVASDVMLNNLGDHRLSNLSLSV